MRNLIVKRPVDFEGFILNHCEKRSHKGLFSCELQRKSWRVRLSEPLKIGKGRIKQNTRDWRRMRTASTVSVSSVIPMEMTFLKTN